MIGYITLGTNDLDRAIDFYEKLLAPLNPQTLFNSPRMKAWNFGPSSTALAVALPFDQNSPPSAGNGTMVALAMPDQKSVDQMHALALSLGATDEGAPGERIPGVFYGGYFRDLDGNKLNFFHMNLPK